MPSGFTFLVTGQPGSGKEILLKQYAGAKGKEGSSLYFSATESADEVKSLIQSHGWAKDVEIFDLSYIYYDRVLSQTLEIARKRETFSAERVTRIASEDLDKSYESELNFVNIVWSNFTDAKKPCKAVFDCMEFIADYHSQQEAIHLMQAVKIYTQNTGGLSLFSLTKELYPTMQLRMESIADCVIELDTFRRLDEVERIIVVKKIKNLQHKLGINRYIISDDGFEYDTMKRVV